MYKHKVNYYETDKMGITHHSNYIRWMEEARIDYLEKLGYGYMECNVRLSEAPGFGEPINVFDKSATGTVAYRELAKEFTERNR